MARGPPKAAAGVTPPPPSRKGRGLLDAVDHLVWAVPELDAGIDEVERRLGVRPAPGGRHPRWGTRNALLSLEGC